MNHSFNVDIAKKYGIEKAVILENFYFWIKKNQANRKNMHDGKAYTYNTASAFAELFPYIPERKIAKILREMEFEDGLLLSGQFNKYDRTKSYTLTDNAMSFFEPSIVTKCDNGTSQNVTIEQQESVSCLNTDINTDINSNINADTKNTHAKEKKKSVLKLKLGEYNNVTLTEEELEKLKKELGEKKAFGVINNFSEYREMKGYKCKSDYLAIKHWGISAYEEREARKQKSVKKEYPINAIQKVDEVPEDIIINF